MLYHFSTIVTAVQATPPSPPTPSTGLALPLSPSAPSNELTPWALLTATAGLIAFHIGLFTLVGRERKSPSIINFIFPIFLLCLLVASFALSGALLPPEFESIALRTSAALLIVAFLVSGLRVYLIAVRSIYFVDSISPKLLPVVRQLRRRKALKSLRRNYSHDAFPISASLKARIIDILSSTKDSDFENRTELEPQALALAVQHQGQGNKLLAHLAEAFIAHDCSIQYLTASRHPIEFVRYLKRHLDSANVDWAVNTKRIVVIDAYSPHFGFLDSIYSKKDAELDALDVTRVVSKMTYAGMHTASSKAFNVLRHQMASPDRRPTLVIYEDSYALTDLESAEQYRIFVRHVMPSERLWDGMFTVFLESSMHDADWRMLQGYASMRLDLRNSRNNAGEKATCPDAAAVQRGQETSAAHTLPTSAKDTKL